MEWKGNGWHAEGDQGPIDGVEGGDERGEGDGRLKQNVRYVCSGKRNGLEHWQASRMRSMYRIKLVALHSIASCLHWNQPGKDSKLNATVGYT